MRYTLTVAQETFGQIERYSKPPALPPLAKGSPPCYANNDGVGEDHRYAGDSCNYAAKCHHVLIMQRHNLRLSTCLSVLL